jgi:hypothetical protein
VWDGNGFNFGYGQDWELYNFSFYDVDLNSVSVDFTQSGTDGIYTDIWDTSLEMYVNSDTLGLSDATYECAEGTDIDITEVDGNVHIDCTTDFAPAVDGDVSIRGHIMVYGPDGDLVRYALEITNNSDETISDLWVRTETDFGSSGEIWGYQNYDAAVLAVPASDNNDNSAAIEETGSDWMVSIDGSDPSGSLAWGNSNGSVDVLLAETDDDVWFTATEDITVEAGETVWVVYFTGWDPAHLNIVAGYDEEGFDSDADAEEHADAVVAKAAEFNSFSGRLTTGLPDGANVVNWGPAPDAELSDTGVDASSMWAGLALLTAGVAVAAVRRRAHS